MILCICFESLESFETFFVMPEPLWSRHAGGVRAVKAFAISGRLLSTRFLIVPNNSIPIEAWSVMSSACAHEDNTANDHQVNKQISKQASKQAIKQTSNLANK